MEKESMVLLLAGACVLYLAYSYSKEGFQGGGGRAGSNSPTAAELRPAPPPVPREEESSCDGKKRVIMETSGSPSAIQAIRSVDDYEYNLVYQAEGDRSISMALRNKLMSQRPMDWAGLPPSSGEFQAGLKESFENASNTVPDDAKPYQNVNGGAMAPPDTDSSEMNERKILQTYVPKLLKQEGKMTTYDVENADELIRKIYDQRGLIPTVAHEKGTNVYEIVGVRRKDEKIVYEGEEAPASTGPVQKAGEATIQVPGAAYDMAASQDPYYDTKAGAGKGRMGKWDYQAWTPGLERMFAPTAPKENWY
jgi:hypothetical protein